MKLTATKTIAAPVERVFAIAADFAGAPEVISGITRVEMLTDGPVGVGTRFRETRRLHGREGTEEMEVTEFEPNERYALGCESHGCLYRTVFRFVPAGEGTEVDMEFAATPQTLVAKILSVVMRPAIKAVGKIVEQDLEDIKTAAEGA